MNQELLEALKAYIDAKVEERIASHERDYHDDGYSSYERKVCESTWEKLVESAKAE